MMKQQLVCLCAVGFLSACALSAFGQDDAKTGFQRIKSYEGNFVVQLPGEPKYSSSNVETDVGDIKLHTFMVEKNQGNVAYFVFYSDYPEGTGEGTGPETILANARDGVIGDEGTKKTAEKKIKVGKYPGLEFDFEQGEGAEKTSGSWRLYMVEDRLYQIGIISIGSPVDTKVRKTIYESFDLLNK